LKNCDEGVVEIKEKNPGKNIKSTDDYEVDVDAYKWFLKFTS
jgi:hypothetical protein